MALLLAYGCSVNMRALLSVLLVLLLVSACGTTEFTVAQQCLRGRSVTPGPAGAAPAAAAGEVLVRYSASPHLPGLAPAGVRQLQAAAVSAAHGLSVLEAGSGSLPDVLRTEGDAEEAARRLQDDPRVAWAFPNWRLQPLGDVSCFEEQWNLSGFGVARAWGRGPGPYSVTVAVIDSGIDVDHPALAEAMLPGFNFHDMTDDPRPVMAADLHGTHVAGIIAAHGDGPVTGVAAFPERIRVLPIRIFDATGRDASFNDLLRALAWAVGDRVPGTPRNSNPADVINLSLGAAVAPHPGVSAAIREIVTSRGVTIVAASGNDTSGRFLTGIHAPANSPEALAVGSVDSDFRRSYFSAFGGPAQLAVMAPGGFGPSSCSAVLSTIPDGAYACEAGTSMAAPFVSGALALLLTHEPGLTAPRLKGRLEEAAWFDRSFMTEEEYGAGVLCADRLFRGFFFRKRSGPC